MKHELFRLDHVAFELGTCGNRAALRREPEPGISLDRLAQRTADRGCVVQALPDATVTLSSTFGANR